MALPRAKEEKQALKARCVRVSACARGVAAGMSRTLTRNDTVDVIPWVPEVIFPYLIPDSSRRSLGSFINLRHDLFLPQYFENGALEPGCRYRMTLPFFKTQNHDQHETV